MTQRSSEERARLLSGLKLLCEDKIPVVLATNTRALADVLEPYYMVPPGFRISDVLRKVRAEMKRHDSNISPDAGLFVFLASVQSGKIAPTGSIPRPDITVGSLYENPHNLLDGFLIIWCDLENVFGN